MWLRSRTSVSGGHQVAGPHGQDDVPDGVQDQLGLLVLDVVALLVAITSRPLGTKWASSRWSWR